MELEIGLVDLLEGGSIAEIRADLRWARESRIREKADYENRSKDWRGRKQALWVSAFAGVTGAIISLIVTKIHWFFSIVSGSGGHSGP